MGWCHDSLMRDRREGIVQKCRHMYLAFLKRVTGLKGSPYRPGDSVIQKVTMGSALRCQREWEGIGVRRLKSVSPRAVQAFVGSLCWT